MSDTGRINVASESTDMHQKRSLDAHKWERDRHTDVFSKTRWCSALRLRVASWQLGPCPSLFSPRVELSMAIDERQILIRIRMAQAYRSKIGLGNCTGSRVQV